MLMVGFWAKCLCCSVDVACCPDDEVPRTLCAVAKIWTSCDSCFHNSTATLVWSEDDEEWQGVFPAEDGCHAEADLVMYCGSSPTEFRMSIAGALYDSGNLISCDPFEVRFCPVGSFGEVRVYASGDERCTPEPLYPIAACNSSCPAEATVQVEVAGLVATISAPDCPCLDGLEIPLSCTTTPSTWTSGEFEACGHTWEIRAVVTFTGTVVLDPTDHVFSGASHSISSGVCRPAFSMTFNSTSLPKILCDGVSGGTIATSITLTAAT